MGEGRKQRASWLDGPVRALAPVCCVLALACVLMTFAVVVLRYGFGRSSIPMQELVLHCNAAVFLLGGAWTLLRDQHVRVDILQQGWSARGKAWAELVGIVLFLLPFCIALLWLSLDYVAASWRQGEGSREVGGLPALYLVKTLIPLSAVLLTLAGAARGMRALEALRR